MTCLADRPEHLSVDLQVIAAFLSVYLQHFQIHVAALYRRFPLFSTLVDKHSNLIRSTYAHAGSQNLNFKKVLVYKQISLAYFRPFHSFVCLFVICNEYWINRSKAENWILFFYIYFIILLKEVTISTCWFQESMLKVNWCCKSTRTMMMMMMMMSREKEENRSFSFNIRPLLFLSCFVLYDIFFLNISQHTYTHMTVHLQMCIGAHTYTLSHISEF